MSKNFVDKVHIDALVTAAVKATDRNSGRPFFYYWNGTRPVTAETADRVGQMLWQANWDVTMSWAPEEDRPFPEIPAYRHDELPGLPNPLLVLHLISYYEYQTVGRPEVWLMTEAAAFLGWLQGHAINRLPGIDEYPWGLGGAEDRDVFVRYPAT
ncbi:MAG: hypothetical protein QOK11_3339 [Pseudonocardiales bacterium]|nr:hypothetical protein [Pseudonocardiales bacterium]